MKKIIDFITEKAMEREDAGAYNTWVNLTHYSDPGQQENIILDYMSYLFNQAKYTQKNHLEHMKVCPLVQPIIKFGVE